MASAEQRKKHYRDGIEHGSAKWGDVKAVDKKYRQEPMENNRILTQNLSIGYTFPEKWMKKARIDNLRVYLSGDNLLTVSDFFYAYDPETPVSKGGYYPQVKTVVLGLNITFK